MMGSVVKESYSTVDLWEYIVLLKDNGTVS